MRYEIKGKVIIKKRAGVAGVRVEAWGTDLILTMTCYAANSTTARCDTVR